MKKTITPNEQRALINLALKYQVPEDTITANFSNSGTITIKSYCKDYENNERIYVEAISRFGRELWVYDYKVSRNWNLIEASK